MSSLLTKAINAKWAILPETLESIFAVVQDHNAITDRSKFHAANEEDKQAIIANMGYSADGTSFTTINGSVGILTIDGPIVPRGNLMSAMSGDVGSLEAYTQELIALENDPAIETIVLNLDSPGGAVTGVSEFAEMVSNLQTKTVAYVYGMAASAAYWIASAADEIVGSVTSEVGSLGVVAGFTDTTEADQKRGFRRIEIVSTLSENKRLDPTTSEGKQAVQTVVDDLAKVFVSQVAENRGTTSEEVLASYGRGLMFVANAAMERGMIDRIDTLENVLTSLNDNPNKQTNPMEGFMSDKNSEPKVMSAEEFKSANPSAYSAIVEEATAIGAKQEAERIKSIEALAESMPEAASFINKEKYAEGMTAEKMAHKIITTKDEIFKANSEGVKKDADALLKSSEEINKLTNDDNDNNPEGGSEGVESKKAVSGMLAGAKQAANGIAKGDK